MSTIQQPLHGPKHLNHGLFSDYYLEEIVPNKPEWDAMLPAARQAQQAIRELLDKVNPAALDEAPLENQWIQPIFAILGHFYSVQVKIRYREVGYRKPDYVFTASQTEALAFSDTIYTAAQLQHGLAVGDAKKWGTPLDQSGGKEARNPSQQIDEYLRYSEISWGILTDGRYWRLYERDSSKNNVYYAVDLLDLVNHPAEAFLYFYAFFCRAAFTESWLHKTLQGSIDYAQRVTEQLEEQVYDALELIAQGFLAYRRNRLTATPDTLHTLYQQSLVLLYRLLFILYAESRDILPLQDNDAYKRQQSLYAIKKTVEHDITFRQPLLDANNTSTYTRLIDLFYVIDQGSDLYELSAYNGRLFSESDHPFLKDKAVGDHYLAQALDKMARVPNPHNPEKMDFIDYRDLDVRHLGAVYEKLLDYELVVAEAPLTFKDARPVQTGEVFLRVRGTENQRKVTGSYYTPDYIVRFMVERMLEPLLHAITERYATLDEAGHWQIQDADALVQAILALNILDPATGSGHFLVEVVAYIAEWLRGLAIAPPDLAEDELLYWKRQVANACIYGVDVNPLAVELAKLSLWLSTLARGKPLSFLDHHLKVGNSLVGARALEIGAQEIRTPHDASQRNGEGDNGQLRLIDDTAFTHQAGISVGLMQNIEHTTVESVANIKEQEELYEVMQRQMEPYRWLANVWTARHFGMTLTPPQWKALRAYVMANFEHRNEESAALIEQAEHLAAQHHFLHWELQFPEVFFAPDGTALDRPGFDAVIGNPPYVRQESIQPYKPYFAAHYEVYQGSADLYVYFYNRGLKLLREGGLLGYITANKWFKAGYGEPLRAYLSTSAAVQEIVDFGHAPIFRDADTFPAIALFRKQPAAPDAAATVTQFPREMLQRVDIKDYKKGHGYAVPVSRFGSTEWSLESPDVEVLMDKIRRTGTPLREFCPEGFYRGILTGLNEAFLIDTATKERLVRDDPKCADIIKPYLRGQDIKRWSPRWDGLWMILLKSSENHEWAWSKASENHEEIFSNAFPSLYKHLKSFENQLRIRQDQGRYWWELRSCTYYNLFERPAIVHTDITWRSQFALSNGSFYLVNTAYLWPTDDLYLLAVVNSPLLWAYMWRKAIHGKDEALRLIYSFVETIPIAQPTDAIRAEIEPAVRRLIVLSKERQQAMRDTLQWLRVEFEVDKAGQKLEAFAALDTDRFIEEVRSRRPRSASRLSPAALRSLQETHAQYAGQVKGIEQETLGLEGRVSDAVNQAYGLTAEEIDLMWRSAPPRMPIKPVPPEVKLM